MATIDADYVTVTAIVGATIGDTAADPDNHPDWVTATEGTVTFTPTVDMVQATNDAGKTVAVVPFPIVCTIDAQGRLTYNGDPSVTLLDLGSSKVNPTVARDKAAYNVTFANVKMDGAVVKIKSFGINPSGADAGTDGTVNLWDIAPLPTGSGGAAIVRGQGVPSITSASAGDVVTYDGTGIKWTGGLQPGVAGGVAQLDSAGVVPVAQVPDLSETYAHVIGLANGTDDTATIQALLNAAGRQVKGLAGQSYKITAPLVIKSGTMLDLTSCTLTLVAGSNCNMIQNYAVSNPQRSVTDAAITSGSTTLTSATANFTSADVGRTVVVTGAGLAAGPFALTANILSVTNAATVTLSVAASTTVAEAATSVYTRDLNIVIVGGFWNRGSNGGGGDDQHSLFLRHVDGLTVDLQSFTSSGFGPKYAVHPGDVTDFDLRVRHFNHVSDGIHVRGPAARGIIHSTEGTTGDDFVVLGASDSSRVSGGAGDITDVEVYDIRPTNLTTNCFKLYGDSGSNIRRIHVNSIRGTGTNSVSVGAAGFTGVNLDDITVENVALDSSTAIALYAGGTTLRLRNISTSYGGPGVCSGISVASAVSWDLIELSGFAAPNFSSAAPGSSVVSVTGTIGTLIVDKVKVSAPASATLVVLNGASASVSTLFLSRYELSSNGTPVKAPTSGQALSRVYMTDGYCSHVAFLADFATNTILHLCDVQHDSPSNGSINLRATANVSILGRGAAEVGGSLSTAAGYVLRVNCPDLRLDLSKVTSKIAGDMAYNSNGALSCGAGTVVTDGTNWKNLFSGATY